MVLGKWNDFGLRTVGRGFGSRTFLHIVALCVASFADRRAISFGKSIYRGLKSLTSTCGVCLNVVERHFVPMCNRDRCNSVSVWC